MAKKISLPRGTFDILPEESHVWHFLRDVIEESVGLFGYREIITPIFEKSDLFERSAGDTSDIVEKEMYKFNDKKGREFSLRPEGTAPVMRSFVANNMGRTGRLQRLYYQGPMFRYDKPQAGRYRQFYQFGIEAVGSQNPYIDAEVIATGDLILKNLKLKDYTLEINSIGCPDCSKDYDNALVEYFKPSEDKLCSDCKRRMEKNPKRLLDCKKRDCKNIAKDAPKILDHICEDCLDKFTKVKNYLDNLGVEYIVNPSIVRGLDYYSNTVFEFKYGDTSQNTIIAGGRYNKLIKELGGKKTSGVGFAGGFSRIIIALKEQKAVKKINPQADVFLITLGENAENYGLKIMHSLRKEKISIINDIDRKSLKAQMKAADKLNCKFTLILGEDELKEEKIEIKNMKTGEQKKVYVKELSQILLNT